MRHRKWLERVIRRPIMRPRSYRKRRDRNRHRHNIDQSCSLIHKQDSDSSTKSENDTTFLSRPQTHDQATQCNDKSLYQLQSCSLSAKPSLSAAPSRSAKSSVSTEITPSTISSDSSNDSRATISIDIDSRPWIHLVTIHNDGTETHEYVKDDPKPLNIPQHEEYPNKSRSQSSSQTISVDELAKLDVTLDNQLGLLAICDNGSEVYAVMNTDKSKMICTLTRHPDRTIDITTRDGQVFKLLQSSTSVTGTISPPKTSTRTSQSTHNKASRQCIWCDNFGHYHSECQGFHEAIRRGQIYVNKCNRIISARSGEQLPLAIGSGGMKAYL